MSNILIPGAPKSAPMVMVDESNKDQYVDPLPIHPLFKVLLLTIYHSSGAARRLNIQVDGNLPNEPKYAKQDVGFFEASFDGWYAVVNWTEQKRDKLAPDYIGVDFRSESVAILGPHATIRTCWHCGATGYVDREKKMPWAEPNKPCRNCEQLDWYNAKVSQESLVIACASQLAKITGKDYLFDGFGGGKAEVEMRRQAMRSKKEGKTQVFMRPKSGLIIPGITM